MERCEPGTGRVDKRSAAVARFFKSVSYTHLDGPPQTGDPGGFNYRLTGAAVFHHAHQHLQGGLVLFQPREQQHLVKQHHSPCLLYTSEPR